MRTYGSLQLRFWSDEEAQALSDQGKLLAVYLLAGPHSNMLGCFRLPAGYIMADLNWTQATVDKAFNELSAMGFLTRDIASGWLVIHNFLRWNPIQNPKQGAGVARLFELVPEKSIVFKLLVKSLFLFGTYLPEGFLNRLDTLSQEWVADQEQDQEQEQEQEQDNDQEQDTEQEQRIVAPVRPRSEESANIQTVFNYWKTTLNHPNAALDDKRKKIIRNALKMGYSVAQLCDAITGCSYTPHNMGDNDRGQRYDGLHVILRDADQIDRFIHNCLNPPKPLNPADKLLQANINAGHDWLQEKMREISSC